MKKTLEESVDYWAVTAVLNGDAASLLYAFDWKSSPQGEVYWCDRACLLVELDDADYDFLRSLL